MPKKQQLFDLQVNGFAGVDFNSDFLTAEELQQACQALAKDGVSGILATIITDELEVMQKRIRRLVEARNASEEAKSMVHGIHVEGPFLNVEPGYIGTHPPAAACHASPEHAKPLLEAGEGLVRLLTLAPEQDPQAKTTRWLVDQGVVVSAGHCNPTLYELKFAIDQGLSVFTHLGNGCPLQIQRHDNIIQRVLSVSDRLWVCFIADGVHVPYLALRNYLKIVGHERAIVVSDAISAAGLGQGEFSVAGQKVIVDESLATWSADRSHLMGAAVSISQANDNLQNHLGFSEQEALLLTSRNPQRAIGL